MFITPKRRSPRAHAQNTTFPRRASQINHATQLGGGTVFQRPFLSGRRGASLLRERKMEDPASLLRRAVYAVFSEWTALGMAVENEWGGHATRDKALALLEQVVNGLLQSDQVHQDEIQDLLDQARPCNRHGRARARARPCGAHARRCWTTSTSRPRTTARGRSRGCSASCTQR